uniref:Uncharacterized protein n=1 Tax=Oryza meridionalis TaxID=40149 RepID=A0A0E0F5M0_9ORYZ
MKDSDNDVGMVIGGYAQDPYDDRGLEELMQDQDALEKSHIDGTSVEITSKLVILLISHCCFFSHCFIEIRN